MARTFNINMKKNFKIVLTHKNSGETYIYKEPIYTKLNSVYGYLTVSGYNVYFIWNVETYHTVDNVSDEYSVEYINE